MIKKKDFIASGLFILELALTFSILSLFGYAVVAGVGENVTVITQLDIGNVFPDITNVSLDDGAATVTLTANDTTTVSCIVIARDYNGEGDINGTNNVTAIFYDNTLSNPTDPDDNNTHYTNNTCDINESFTWMGVTDDQYTLLANCTFQVQYYANPGNWTCNATVSDTYNWQDTKEDYINISELLSIGLPPMIHYGTVNATYVSDQNITNVTNYGNVGINLSLSAYAVTEGDGYAMNCTQGNVQNISTMYEKFNLTVSNTDQLSLTEFEGNYTNVSDTPEVRNFQLDYNQNDALNNATKETYWRIYVPLGVAGSCTGNIIFGATKAAGA